MLSFISTFILLSYKTSQARASLEDIGSHVDIAGGHDVLDTSLLVHAPVLAGDFGILAGNGLSQTPTSLGGSLRHGALLGVLRGAGGGEEHLLISSDLPLKGGRMKGCE